MIKKESKTIYESRLKILVLLPFLFSIVTAQYLDYLSSGLKNAYNDPVNRWTLTVGGISLIALHTLDDDIQEYTREHPLMNEKTSRFLDLYGGGYAYPIGLVLVGTSTYIKSGKNYALSSVKYYTTSIVLSSLVTDALKTITHRQRPNGNNNRSFPSGHTTGSFAIATCLNSIYGSEVGAVAYLIASAVGLQRIHDNKHWLTDVLVGGVIGTVIPRGFAEVYSKDKKIELSSTLNKDSSTITIVIPIR